MESGLRGHSAYGAIRDDLVAFSSIRCLQLVKRLRKKRLATLTACQNIDRLAGGVDVDGDVLDFGNVLLDGIVHRLRMVVGFVQT